MNTQVMSLTDILRRLRETYLQERQEYTAIVNELQKFNKNWEQEVQRGWRDLESQRDAQIKNGQQKSELNKRLREQIEKSYTEIDRYKEECEKYFGIMNRATPDKLDMTAVELIKSGILTTKELKALANDYKDNIVMQRYIGEYAYNTGEKKGDDELRRLGSVLKQYKFPYEEQINAAVDWCKMGIREDFEIANAIHEKHFEENYEKIMSSSQGIHVDISPNSDTK